ncbi:MAG: cation diffusion facilitator family transporter [bacterium]
MQNDNVREKKGITASIIGCIVNFILFLIKLIIGLFSNSISVIGDAINNLTDMGSAVVSLLGFKISSKPADKEHPFGHQRAEYIAGLIISIVIIVVGIEVFSNSIQKIINNDNTNYSYVTVIVLIVSIILKVMLAIYNFKIGKKINSITLIATAKDSLNDVISTTVILISAIVSLLFKVNIDGYVGVFVSLFILYSGICLVKETVNPLLGEKVSNDLIIEITKFINSNDNILGVHDVVAHMYGPNNIFMSLHAEVDATKNILDIHTVIDNIEFEIKNKYNVSLVIHMDPVDLNCNVTSDYRKKISSHLKSINEYISFHDFRCVISTTHINILFDVVTPFDSKIDSEIILKSLNNLLKDEKVKVNLIINFEHDFSTNN